MSRLLCCAAVAAVSLILLGEASAQTPRAPAPPRVAPPPTPTPATAEETVSIAGRVAAVGKSTLTVDRDTEGRASFRVGPETKIEVNSDLARLDDLKAGDKVRVVVDPDEPDMAREVIVARVVVTTPPGPPARATPRPAPAPSTPVASGVTLGAVVTGTPGDFLLIIDVSAYGPAAAAGIVAGDFVLAIDGQKPPQVIGPQPLHTLTPKNQPGQQVAVSVWRMGKTETVTLTLAAASEVGETLLTAETLIIVDGRQVRLGDVVGRVEGTALEPGAELVIRRRDREAIRAIPGSADLEGVVRELAREVAALRAQLEAATRP